jgi:hypothetical protein
LGHAVLSDREKKYADEKACMIKPYVFSYAVRATQGFIGIEPRRGRSLGKKFGNRQFNTS